jgi:hypothetical protein
VVNRTGKREGGGGGGSRATRLVCKKGREGNNATVSVRRYQKPERTRLTSAAVAALAALLLSTTGVCKIGGNKEGRVSNTADGGQ